MEAGAKEKIRGRFARRLESVRNRAGLQHSNQYLRTDRKSDEGAQLAPWRMRLSSADCPPF